MRTWTLLAPAAWLLVAIGPLRADEDRSDARALQGTWQVVSQQQAGRATVRPNNMLWIVEGETIWLVPGWLAAEQASGAKKPTGNREGQAGKGGKQSGPPRGLRMTFRLGPDKAPKQIDIDGPKKSSSYGIYKLEGDELTVCMGISQPSLIYDKQAKPDESTRPTAISPEAGTVIVLKRVRD
jgi:uncharacterized protein (TIGR03067 family)